MLPFLLCNATFKDDLTYKYHYIANLNWNMYMCVWISAKIFAYHRFESPYGKNEDHIHLHLLFIHLDTVRGRWPPELATRCPIQNFSLRIFEILESRGPRGPLRLKGSCWPSRIMGHCQPGWGHGQSRRFYLFLLHCFHPTMFIAADP